MTSGVAIGTLATGPLPALSAPAVGSISTSSIHPLDLLKIMQPADWERFTLEWATELQRDYVKVEQASGSGDLGCDIVATKASGGWDNYQCKRYAHPLAPSDAWLELGKHIYYSFMGVFPPADEYFFVAPQGVGTTLASLFRNPARLKAGLEQAWGKHCRTHITSSHEVVLTGPLKSYFDGFDFGIFDYVTPLELIEGHATSPYHSFRFPVSLAPRPAQSEPDPAIGENETRYVKKVCDAYSQDNGAPVQPATLPNKYQRHFGRVRQAFYSAEELRSLYAEAVPPGTFENLKQEIFDAVELTATGPYPSGMARLTATVQHATQVQITNSPLLSRMRQQDRHGICHQLANDDLLTWVDND